MLDNYTNNKINTLIYDINMQIIVISKRYNNCKKSAKNMTHENRF